jgi:hypothetical protein
MDAATWACLRCPFLLSLWWLSEYDVPLRPPRARHPAIVTEFRASSTNDGQTDPIDR